MYSPFSFFWGRVLSEMPQHTILIFIMATIGYLCFGFQDSWEVFWKFTGLLTLEGLAGAGLLFMISAFSHDLDQVCFLYFYDE